MTTIQETPQQTLRRLGGRMSRAKAALYDSDNHKDCQKWINEVASLGDQIRKLRKEIGL